MLGKKNKEPRFAAMDQMDRALVELEEQRNQQQPKPGSPVYWNRKTERFEVRATTTGGLRSAAFRPSLLDDPAEQRALRLECSERRAEIRKLAKSLQLEYGALGSTIQRLDDIEDARNQ